MEITKAKLSRQELLEKLILSQDQVLAYSKDFAQIYRKERERSRHLEETHKKLKAIVNSISDAVVATDDNLIITEFNKAFENLIESKDKAIPGAKFTKILQNQEVIRKLKKFKLTKSSVLSFEFLLLNQNDSVYLATVTKIENHQTHRNGFVFVLRDITESKRLEKLRDSLFTFASREITAPLNGLLGFLNYLYDDLKKKLSEDETAHFRFLIESGKNLENIIEDLMKLSPLTPENESQETPVEMNETVLAAIKHVESEFHSLEDRVYFEESNKVYILVDKILFSKAIESILRNFHSFCEGSTKINLVTNQDGLEVQFVASSLKNKALNLKKLLETQNSNEINGQHINLSLAKDIVELNGGKLQICEDQPAMSIEFSEWNSELHALVKKEIV